jgi:hypothetical protein
LQLKTVRKIQGLLGFEWVEEAAAVEAAVEVPFLVAIKHIDTNLESDRLKDFPEVCIGCTLV